MRAGVFGAAVACVAVTAMVPAAAAAQAPSPSSTGAAPSGPTPGGVTSGERGPGERAPASGRPIVHYERSRTYYAAGRYRASIVELETAIRLDPTGTNLYFDLGLLYERVGRIDRAMEAYRTYLVRTSDAAERERAERIIRRLSGAQDELRDLYQTRTGRADGLFWGMFAGGVTGVVAGSILVVSAVRTDNEVTRLRGAGAPEMTVNDTAGSALGQYVAGASLLAVGVGLGATAFALYFTREAPPRSAPICITASAQGVGVTVGGSF